MTELYPYQQEAIELIHQFKGRSVLAYPMGTGKSIISLSYINKYHKDKTSIIVCPASLKLNWQNEISKHFGLRSEVLEGRRQSIERVKRPHPFVIINYDILVNWLDYLKSLKASILICDECHYVGNPKAKRTRGLKRLCKGIPHIVALSGTPLVNRPSELFPIINILRPDIFPSFRDYVFEYCGPKLGSWGGWTFTGATNLPKLHKQLLDSLLIRRTKEEVLPQLPKKRRIVVPIELDDKKEYQHAVRDFLGWMRERNPSKLVNAEKAQQIVQLGYLKRLAGLLKIKNVMEWIDNFLEEEEGKIIVFAIHKAVVKRLSKKYKNLCVTVDGSVRGRDRQLAFDKFLKNKSTRIFIGNIKAAGVGWSAKGVSTVAFVELDWVPGVHSQAEDRCHGLGRGEEGVSPDIYYLIANGTIEKHLLKILQSKQEVLNSTLDGEACGESLDVYDLLTKAILEDKK